MTWWLIIFFKILNFLIIVLVLVWATINHIIPTLIKQFTSEKNKAIVQQKLMLELDDHHRALHQKWVIAHQQREKAQQKIDSWKHNIEQQNQLIKKVYKSRAKRIDANNEHKQELHYQRKLKTKALFIALHKAKKELKTKIREKANKIYLEKILNQLRGD
jgi:hypothetical protein